MLVFCCCYFLFSSFLYMYNKLKLPATMRFYFALSSSYMNSKLSLNKITVQCNCWRLQEVLCLWLVFCLFDWFCVFFLKIFQLNFNLNVDIKRSCTKLNSCTIKCKVNFGRLKKNKFFFYSCSSANSSFVDFNNPKGDFLSSCKSSSFNWRSS